ncbi:hypothetical protein AVEN_32412-1 [Araneus ventricosus]|uniref:Integrase p58-like C-terminal domain-containing protein n=1 Tax=Araneus ventricosus TaxID=182803 RepID=A0A4Y2R1U6_ARAVE|nr:hypothetical protein AVEN_32412-1 [Araneus ventricosus]
MYNPKRRRGLSPKLQQNWEGPYTIVKKLNDVIYRVQRSPNAKPKVTEKTVDDPVPGPSRISTLESQNNGSTKSSVDTETATNEFPVSHVIKSSAQIFERRISSYLMKTLSVSETQKSNNDVAYT